MPRTKRIHQLKRPNIRQDWSKWNLYNLSRIRNPQVSMRTFFQQKWTAKSMLRAYHNADVREGTWTRMFDRRLPAVVPMNHRYLAKSDGSEMAGGRGMGIQRAPTLESRQHDRPTPKTSYMHMTFHPLERRLDTAIFRALFASSTRQARQFVVHGWVKVNGKKMVYPGYALNPGDMFQVDPERVMFATGVTKFKTAAIRRNAKRNAAQKAKRIEASKKQQEAEAEIPKASEEQSVESDAAPKDPEEARNQAGRDIRGLMNRTRSLLEETKDSLPGKRLKELRAVSKTARKLLSKYRGIDEWKLDDTIGELQSSFTEILAKIPEHALPKQASTTSTQQPSDAKASSKISEYRAQKDAELLARALRRVRENPVDQSKPYRTPWRPRDYMPAFAFIPRYLEVNQNICSAVYLRHPVARPGLAEVPTPYSGETMALAFNWYLRRR